MNNFVGEHACITYIEVRIYMYRGLEILVKYRTMSEFEIFILFYIIVMYRLLQILSVRNSVEEPREYASCVVFRWAPRSLFITLLII